MSRPRWEACKLSWSADGSLRDVYVQSTDLEDWSAFIEVASGYECEYLFGGQLKALPTAEDIFDNRRGTHLLRIRVGPVAVHSHFFVPEEIELDIDPREVKGPQEHAQLIMFLENVAHRLNKPIILTPENAPDEPYLSYEPSSRVWTQ